MPTTIKIKNSDLLRQVLDQVNVLELRYYDEDMNEMNTLRNPSVNYITSVDGDWIDHLLGRSSSMRDIFVSGNRLRVSLSQAKGST